jgi:hypothetical protein
MDIFIDFGDNHWMVNRIFSLKPVVHAKSIFPKNLCPLASCQK